MPKSELSQQHIVLLVDDDPSHLKLYSWVISRGGYRAVTALVGSSSVVFPNDRKIDIALMDYRLSSELTAADVARNIRAEFPGVPIILISELLWVPDDVRGLVDAFVTKGDPEKILETIGEMLALKPGSAALQAGATSGEVHHRPGDGPSKLKRKDLH